MMDKKLSEVLNALRFSYDKKLLTVDSTAAKEVTLQEVLTAIQDLNITFPSSINISNFPSSQEVHVNNFPAFPTVQPVSGSVSAAVSGNVNVGNFPSSFNVSNFPVSQSVTGTFWPATQPVSGTFWQTTQPVSISTAIAVTGTFWQATQPISVVALPLPAGAAADSSLTTIKNVLDNIKLKTDNIDVQLSTRTKPADVQHVTVDSSALPTGAATGLAQVAISNQLATIIGPNSIVSVFTAVVGNTTVIAAPGASLSIWVKRITLSSTLTSVVNPSLTEGIAGTVRKKWLTTSAFNFYEETSWKLPVNTALVLNTSANAAAGVQINVEYSIV